MKTLDDPKALETPVDRRRIAFPIPEPGAAAS
jgi:hypothetical protein